MKPSIRHFGVAVLALQLVASGCARQQPMAEPETSESEPTVVSAPTLAPKELALKAKDELFKRLSSELMAAMSNGGPSAAIEVCSQKAPAIAAEVGEELGVAIGRTSFKLRNPTNKPPEWAETFVAQRTADPQFVELEDQRTGALLPIRLKAQCLVCHGPKNAISEDVREQLATLYPDDSATGFKDGDLRGWFWVEVPAKKSL